jgi:hypothetical protein
VRCDVREVDNLGNIVQKERGHVTAKDGRHAH